MHVWGKKRGQLQGQWCNKRIYIRIIMKCGYKPDYSLLKDMKKIACEHS